MDFRKVKKKTGDITINNIRNLIKLKKENEAIKERIIRDANKSVYIASRTYQSCWQYAIILAWKTWSSVKSVKLLN